MAELEKRKGNPGDVRKKAQERRRYIVQGVRLSGKLSLSELESEFPGVGRAKIQEDVRELNKIGLPYEVIRNEIVDGGEKYSSGMQARRDLNNIEKNLVADLALSFIVGFDSKYPPPFVKRAGSEKVSKFYNFHTINSMFGIAGLDHPLERQWRDMLAETSRMVAIDAGTTNEILAAKLAGIDVPVLGTKLNYLTVCTNSRNIFQTLGQGDVPIRTIVVGGQQRGRTPSIAGALAEVFVRTAALLQFGCAIIGATSIATDTGYCYADTQEDAVMKGLLLGKSALRVIVADSNKISGKMTGGGYATCALDTNFVDVVITNAPIDMPYLKTGDETKRRRQEEQIKGFQSCVKHIVSKGIMVLIAESDETIKWDGYTSKVDR